MRHGIGALGFAVILALASPIDAGCDSYDWCPLYVGNSRAGGTMHVTDEWSFGTFSHTFGALFADVERPGELRIRACSVDGNGHKWRADLTVVLPPNGTTTELPVVGSRDTNIDVQLFGELHQCRSEECANILTPVISYATTGTGTVTVDATGMIVDFDTAGMNGVGHPFTLTAHIETQATP